MSEETRYSLGAGGSSSQRTVAAEAAAAEAAEGPEEELVGPMKVVVVVVVLDPRCSEAAGPAPVAAESRAVGAEAEEAPGPRGLNWAEGLGLTASMEAVPEPVLGSSLTVAAELSSKEAAAARGTAANPEEEPEAAGPMEAEPLELAAPRAAVPGLSVGAAEPMAAAAENPCSAAEAMAPGAAECAPEVEPNLDAPAGGSAAGG